MRYIILFVFLLLLSCNDDVKSINQNSPVKLKERAVINQKRQTLKMQFAANPDKIFFLSIDTTSNQKLLSKFDILSKSLIFEVEDDFIDFSCNQSNDWMIAAKKNELILLEQPNGTISGNLPLADSVDQVAFSENIRYSAFTQNKSDNSITIYDNINGEEKYSFIHNSFINKDRIMLFSPQNEYFVASGKQSATASAWKMSDGSAVADIIHTDKTDGLLAIAFSGEGSIISTASTNKIIVKSWPEMEKICEFETGYIPVGIHFIFNGRFLIAGFSRSINIYDINKKKLIYSHPIDYLTDFAVAPDDKKLISLQNNGTMKIWGIKSNLIE